MNKQQRLYLWVVKSYMSHYLTNKDIEDMELPLYNGEPYNVLRHGPIAYITMTLDNKSLIIRTHQQIQEKSN